MADAAYDVVVIGAGPGGYVCAIRAAQLGLKTLCIERAELGGICLNWGCIPTKALIRSAELLEDLRHGEKYGISADNINFDFGKVVGRSRDISKKLNKGIASLFKKYKVESLFGSAKFTSPTTLEVATNEGVKQIAAKNVVIATGARPKALPGLQLDGKTIITSKEAMILPQPPQHLLVVGAGAIGIEFAYFYAVMGSKVTVVEMLDSILPLNDREVAGMLAKSLARRGIEIFTGSKLGEVKVGPDGLKAVIVDSLVPPPPGQGVIERTAKRLPIEADVCLLAIGLTGNVEELGLDKVGVKVERGFVVTDEHRRTNVKNIFAIGDVSGPPLLAHKASVEGHGVADVLAGKRHEPLNKDQIPGCTYCHPQLASVGLTEEECKARKLDYVVGKFPFQASGMAMAAGEEEGLVKVIFGKQHGELLGAHVLGARASDLVSELTLAQKMECTYEEILATVHAHPTFSEAVLEASAQAFGQAIHI